WQMTRTGADGTFELAELRPDLRHVLFVRREGYGALTYDFPQSETRESTLELDDMIMPAPATVAGVIADERGHGLPDLWLTREGTNGDRLRFSLAQEPLATRYLQGMSGRTDDLGRFAFTDLAPGQYTLTIGVPGRTREHRQSLAIREGEVLDPIAITL